MSEKEMNKYGEGVGFERIRRITGYLVGTVDRFNNAKRAEVNDRRHVRVREVRRMPLDPLLIVAVRPV